MGGFGQSARSFADAAGWQQISARCRAETGRTATDLGKSVEESAGAGPRLVKWAREWAVKWADTVKFWLELAGRMEDLVKWVEELGGRRAEQSKS